MTTATKKTRTRKVSNTKTADSREGNTPATPSFVERVLAERNKSEAEIERAEVEAFVENAIIECETQINLYKFSEIPKKDLELKQAHRYAEKLEKELETVKLDTRGNFEDYLTRIQTKKKEIFEVQSSIGVILLEKLDLVAQIEQFEEIKQTFKS